MIGIYKITNLVNGKVYIGQSRQIEKDGHNTKRQLNFWNKINGIIRYI